MKALVLAGGSGKRLGADVLAHNKCMLRLFGKPLIQYSFENACAAEVSEIVVVVGHAAEEIINTFGNSFEGIRLKYVIQYDARGLVHAIECARKAIGNEDFMLFLADEILSNPRHAEMIRTFRDEQLFVICGVVDEPDLEEIRKTYAVIQDASDRRIYRMIEKPRCPLNHIRGTGNCIFRPGIFEYIDLTPVNQNRGEKELPDLIQCAIDDGHPIKSFDIGSDYINVNTPSDIEQTERVYSASLQWLEEVESR